ncbi:MAG: mannosyltransferase [Burkholderiaceae bacterium]|nr:MAG: mannosyltransferase [Burkholderiaceae bacterium]
MSAHRLSRKHRAELWLARWMQRFYAAWPRALEAHQPAPFAQHAFGPAQPCESAIPRIVWAYWDGAEPPLLVRRCFDHWRALMPGWRIHVLDSASVRDQCGALPAALAGAAAPQRADWIRLELLRRHGGIWLDASTILTQPLDWVLAEQAHARSDFVGYYLERYTSDPWFPVVENWFMAAPPGSLLIEDLQREFTEEVLPRGNAGYIAHLQALGVYETVRQAIDIPGYLSMHLALQRVLRRQGRYRLSLGKAEDGPFYYHALGRWGRTPLKVRLLFSRAPQALPPVIKLRAPDRKRLDEYLARGLYVPDSVADRFLLPHPSRRAG